MQGRIAKTDTFNKPKGVNMNELDFPKNEQAFPDEFNDGMTLRDYFAARALPVCYKFWMHDYYHPDCLGAQEIAKEVRSDFDASMMSLIADYSYEMADAMLKARESNKQE